MISIELRKSEPVMHYIVRYNADCITCKKNEPFWNKLYIEITDMMKSNEIELNFPIWFNMYGVCKLLTKNKKTILKEYNFKVQNDMHPCTDHNTMKYYLMSGLESVRVFMRTITDLECCWSVNIELDLVEILINGKYFDNIINITRLPMYYHKF
uniref:ORF26 n=1 Tax=Malaco herpesvirus 2 TaxID=3031798 RepID=A0AA48P8X0_9VIRU|nr:TPA_asm: ORF26 [Malaco herpesvirus 2]